MRLNKNGLKKFRGLKYSYVAFEPTYGLPVTVLNNGHTQQIMKIVSMLGLFLTDAFISLGEILAQKEESKRSGALSLQT